LDLEVVYSDSGSKFGKWGQQKERESLDTGSLAQSQKTLSFGRFTAVLIRPMMAPF